MPETPNDSRDASGGDDRLPEDGVRRDIRTSRHQDLGVEVSRDLTSQGRLARGGNTNMSRLAFRVGAVPRQERDPELDALREPPRPAAKVAEQEPPPAPASAAPPASAVPDAEAPPPPRGLTRMLGKLFGRGGA